MEITKIGPVYCSSEEYISKRVSNFVENGLQYVWRCGYFGSSCLEVIGIFVQYFSLDIFLIVSRRFLGILCALKLLEMLYFSKEYVMVDRVVDCKISQYKRRVFSNLF